MFLCIHLLIDLCIDFILVANLHVSYTFSLYCFVVLNNVCMYSVMHVFMYLFNYVLIYVFVLCSCV